MSDAAVSEAPPSVPVTDNLEPTPTRKPRGRPAGIKSTVKPERKISTPQHRIDQLKAELQKAEKELREHQARQAEIGWPVVIHHAQTNPEFNRQLSALLRAEVKNKGDLAVLAELLA